MLDRIVVVGAGHTADSLLPRLKELAPTTVIDTSEQALASLRGVAAADPSRVTLRVGDGTSRLVLEDLRGRGDVGLVAATGEDRQNLEVCRIGRELGFGPIIGIAIDAAAEGAYEKLGVRAVVRATLLGQVVERALRYDGLAMATTVGQGHGEIVEFTVLPGSPAVGVSLAELRAEGWRIAAIYRDGRLVIPTGETRIEAEDRILLVGSADLVVVVAEQLRVGRPMFPMPHGPNVGVYLPGGRDEPVEEEARALTKRTRADALVRLWPNATPRSGPLDPSATSADGLSKKSLDVPLVGLGLRQHLDAMKTAKVGVIATRVPGRTLADVLLGRGGLAADLCNGAKVPVMFLRGNASYARVVHAVLDDVLDERVAYEAIDLARMLSLPVVIVRVSLPAYIASPPENVGRVVASIERRLRLHEVPFETVALTGNPVHGISGYAKPTDLLVLGRQATGQDSFSAPDVAIRIARKTKASVLVRTFSGS